MRNLYYYSDLSGRSGWFTDAKSFRKAHPEAKLALRTAHVGIEAPKGYGKPNGELAFAAITRTAKTP